MDRDFYPRRDTHFHVFPKLVYIPVPHRRVLDLYLWLNVKNGMSTVGIVFHVVKVTTDECFYQRMTDSGLKRLQMLEPTAKKTILNGLAFLLHSAIAFRPNARGL